MFDESICLNHCKLMGGRGGEGVESHMHYQWHSQYCIITSTSYTILNNVTKVRQKTKW